MAQWTLRVPDLCLRHNTCLWHRWLQQLTSNIWIESFTSLWGFQFKKPVYSIRFNYLL